MRRRRQSDDDSLELLLDTICNMFGTIMFVALIAALLALVSRRDVAEQRLTAIDDLKDRSVERLVELERDLSERLEKLPAPRIDAEGVEAAEKVQKAIGEIDRRQRLLAELRKALESAQAGSDAVGRDMEPLRAEVQRLEDAIAAAEVMKSRKVRTPMEREMNLQLYVIVIWKGRLYPICDWSDWDPDGCGRLVSWHQRYTRPEACRTAGYCGSQGIQLSRFVALRPDSGIPITDLASLRADPAFKALLRSLDAKRDLVLLAVAPDSFETVAIAKEAFLSAGFNYRMDVEQSKLPEYRDSWVEGIPLGF